MSVNDAGTTGRVELPAPIWAHSHGPFAMEQCVQCQLEISTKNQHMENVHKSNMRKKSKPWIFFSPYLDLTDSGTKAYLSSSKRKALDSEECPRASKKISQRMLKKVRKRLSLLFGKIEEKIVIRGKNESYIASFVFQKDLLHIEYRSTCYC